MIANWLYDEQSSSWQIVHCTFFLSFYTTSFFSRYLLRIVVLRGVSVVAWVRVGCSVVLERSGIVVIRGLGVVGTGSIRSRVVFWCLSGVVYLGALV
jgi:hypothetical protein